MAIPVVDTLNPVNYSIEECKFLIEHLGKAPVLAMREIHAQPLPDPARHPTTHKIIDKNPTHYPDGVTPAAVRPALERIYELQELERAAGEPWVGLEAVKAALQTYIDKWTAWQKDSRRGAPRFPTMHSFDTKNKPHLGGPGSDSGRVSTYFDAAGERKLFAIQLTGVRPGEWKPEWADVRDGTEQMGHPGLVLNAGKLRYECFCGHTEHFKPESRLSQNAARSRMAKHLLKASDSPEKHREIHTAEFGS